MSIAVGAVVTWTYVVENIGPVPLSNIVVTDNQGVNVTCPQSQLGVGQPAMTCTATGVAVNTSGLSGGVYANIGIVTADGSDVPGGGGRSSVTVTDTDPSHYDNAP